MIQEKNKIYQLYLKSKSNILVTKSETLHNLIKRETYLKPNLKATKAGTTATF